jgi:hypothetical protein
MEWLWRATMATMSPNRTVTPIPSNVSFLAIDKSLISTPPRIMMIITVPIICPIDFVVM